MNNVFDIKRFGKYFAYDLRRAKNNYGISLLVMGLMPVAFFLIAQFINLISGNGFSQMPEPVGFIAIFVTIVVVILGAGTKIYGSITEKRAGSDYLMLPASTLEKWLSMVLIVCIVLPVILFALLIATDFLMNLIFPIAYGERIFGLGLGAELTEMLDAEGISFNFPAIMFLSWCENILIFTLGAICFKKAKVAKTLLCMMAFSMIISPLMVLIFGRTNIDTDWLMERFNDADSIINTINWALSILYTLVIGGLLAGLYFRLRTLKH